MLKSVNLLKPYRSKNQFDTQTYRIANSQQGLIIRTIIFINQN
jgi:hypothetical protein